MWGKLQNGMPLFFNPFIFVFLSRSVKFLVFKNLKNMVNLGQSPNGRFGSDVGYGCMISLGVDMNKSVELFYK